MKKQIIVIFFALLLLAGCGNNKDSSKEAEKSTTSPSETPVETTSPEGDDPSEITDSSSESETTTKFPQIPGEVLYSDNNNVGVKAPHGGLFFNGQPVESEAFDALVGNSMVTVTPDFATSPEADKYLPEGMKPSTSATKKPDTTTADTTAVKETTIKNEDKYNLGEYVSSGNTDLAITKVQIFSSSEPGKDGVKYFKPGETFFINLWCNNEFFLDTEVLLISQETKHKTTYDRKEIMASADMMLSNVHNEGQLFCEVEIPKNITKGVYELRFLCGGEEGYIAYHIG